MIVSDPNHPLWSLLRLVVVNASVLAGLVVITSKWDGEYGVAAVTAITTVAVELWQRRRIKRHVESERRESYELGIWDSHNPKE